MDYPYNLGSYTRKVTTGSSCSPASEDAWGSSVLPSGFRSNASAGMVV